MSPPTPPTPLDEGMPQERTLLAWRRTALTLAIGSFALARLALETSLVIAIVLAVVALIVVATVVINSLIRYKNEKPAPPSGATTALVAFVTITLAITEIILIFIR